MCPGLLKVVSIFPPLHILILPNQCDAKSDLIAITNQIPRYSDVVLTPFQLMLQVLLKFGPLYINLPNI